jgi:hypothetical protein
MVAPKIFISHAVKSDDEAKVIWALHDRLDAAGFEVLLDVARLDEELGGPWRTTLNTWIEVCDSAILVFNERAKASRWVFYESALLAWRRQRDDNFVLIPLIIPPSLPSDLSKGPFEPHNIAEIQAITTTSLDYLDRVVESLGPVLERLRNAQSKASSRAAKVENGLTTLLYDVKDEEAVLTAALDLGADLTRWQPKLNRRRALARLLLQADLLKACEVVIDFSNLVPQQLVRIRDYLVPGWVSFQAAGLIEPTAKGQSSERLLGLNSRKLDTFKMYLHRAAGRPEDLEWLWHEENPLTSRAASEIVNSVREGFRRQLSWSPTQVDLRLNDPTADTPIFVLLVGEEPEKSQLDLVRANLQAITFFVTTEEESATEEKATRSGARLLLPLLEPEAEEAALKAYYEATLKIRIPEK